MPDGIAIGAPPEAPYARALAPGPARAAWVRAADGVRLRVVLWPREGARGTVLLLVGRTEYAEKYAPVAADLGARGFACATVDWRGQGLSDRLGAERALGHVGRFADYQGDLAALVAATAGMPRPLFLLSHSMGGAIGLRALMSGLDVAAAAFVAPMWGIAMQPRMRPVAWGLSGLSRAVGLSGRLAPGQDLRPYLARAAFEGNGLTGDRATFERLCAEIAVEPDLALGGPTLRWLHEALREMRRLAAMPAPDVPSLVLLGEREAVVDPARVHRRMRGWSAARLMVFEGARHELLMEAPAIRERALDAVAAHFEANG